MARRHVITAAHCLYHWKDDIAESEMQPDEVAVRLGDHNIEDDNGDNPRFINVVQIEKHSNWIQKLNRFSNHENGYDIAILELAIDLSLKTYTPACLAKNWADPPFGQYGIAVGWGAIREFPWYSLPEVPYEVSLRIVRPNKKECNNWDNGYWRC